MTQTLILFKHEVHPYFYLWNGKYPVGLSGGWNTQQPSWSTDARADLPEKELALFKKLENNRARVFEFKDRGRFNILNRTKIEIDDKD